MQNSENLNPERNELLSQIPDDLVRETPRRHRGLLKTGTCAVLVSLGTAVAESGDTYSRPGAYLAGCTIMGVGGILIVSEGQISDRRKRALQNIRERLRRSA